MRKLFFDRAWRKAYHKSLKKYASHHIPPNASVALFPHFFWLWAVQAIAVGFGLKAGKAVPFWALCILPLLEAVILIAAYYREREGGIAGFFRYISILFVLVGLSVIELAITVSIHQNVPYALYFSVFAGLITLAILMYYIRKQVECEVRSKEDQNTPSGAPFLAGALGLGTYWICKQFLPEQGTSVFIVIVIGIMAAVMFGGAVMNWLKSIGAEDDTIRK